MDFLRVRTLWDDNVVDDRVFPRCDGLRIGSGGDAHVPVTGPDGKYVWVMQRGDGYEVLIPPETVAWVEHPGGDREPAPRSVPLAVKDAAVALGFANADGVETRVELSRVASWRERFEWETMFASVGVVGLALFLGLNWRFVRKLWDGDASEGRRPPQLTARDAAQVRIQFGPAPSGASRPQAGAGEALHGRKDAARLVPKQPELVKAQAAPKRGRPKTKTGIGPRLAVVDDGIKIRDKAPDNVVKAPAAVTPEPRRTRAQTLEDAQAALLAADVRKAVEGFTKASKDAPLDYDQLNWQGLAHYLSGELADAEKVWGSARDMNPRRSDAINNLAGIAKRRGDTVEERRLLAMALALKADDCHASNSLALALAKAGDFGGAERTLADSDGWCGGGYAYTDIQRAGILALKGDRDGALKALEAGLARIDTLIPIKEFEVATDLRLDPAFVALRGDARFAALANRYLPRAAKWATGESDDGAIMTAPSAPTTSPPSIEGPADHDDDAQETEQ